MTRICWRSDGEYFVFHFVDELTNSRKFQVFTREGILHSTVEKNVNVLDGPISWKFSKSQLIASSIYRFNKHEIIFFERNGLMHGSFTLPFDFGKMKVNEILWNIDSSILCIWSELTDLENEVQSDYQSVIQLWTVSNYHWYLKQSFNFDRNKKISCVSWDQEDSTSLHVLTINGNYFNFKFGWGIDLSSCVESNNASIAVIDGSNVLITPFKFKIIPPPMSLYKLNCSKAINKIIWSNTNLDIMAYSFDGILFYYKYKKVNTSLKATEEFEYLLICQAKLENKNKICYKNLIWISPNEMLAVSSDQDEPICSLILHILIWSLM